MKNPDDASFRPTALVTGASVGIGLELARVLAANGHDLVLVARDRERLERAAAELTGAHQVRCRVLVQDLSAPGAAQSVVGELARDGVDVDVLVNNAGFGNHGPFAQTDLDADLRLLQVNIVALTALTKLLLATMLARGRGRIMNVASTAAFLPGPLMATYYASKAYVLHFTEALADEVAGRGVTVTALCPGPVRTEFAQRAGILGSRLFRSRAMQPDAVARAAYRGMMRGRRIVIPGAANVLLSSTVRFVPRRWVTRVAHRLNEVH